MLKPLSTSAYKLNTKSHVDFKWIGVTFYPVERSVTFSRQGSKRQNKWDYSNAIFLQALFKDIVFKLRKLGTNNMSWRQELNFRKNDIGVSHPWWKSSSLICENEGAHMRCRKRKVASKIDFNPRRHCSNRPSRMNIFTPCENWVWLKLTELVPMIRLMKKNEKSRCSSRVRHSVGTWLWSRAVISAASRVHMQPGKCWLDTQNR